MTIQPSRLAAVVVLVAGSTLALTGEGRIPLYRSTTITDPGRYVVTNDFAPSSGPALTIVADDVSIDLNGRTVGGNIVLNLNGGNRHLTIENGHITGAIQGTFPLVEPTPPLFASQVVLTHVIVDGAIVLDPCTGFRLSDSTVGASVSVNGNIGSVAAHVLDSKVAGSLSIGSASLSVIRGNSLQYLTLAQGDLDSSHNLVEGNTILNTLSLAGGGTGSTYNDIRSNVVGSIDAPTLGNHIVGNSVQSGSITASSKNVVESNTVAGSGYCLTLTGDKNIFRNNSFQCTQGGVQDQGTGNTDGGGNVIQ